MITTVDAKPFSLVGYPGNKARLAEQVFLDLPKECGQLTYVDPFFGGGNAYLNLPRKFAAYECSDTLPYVVEFFAKDYTLDTLHGFEEQVQGRYDLDDKDGYYTFRGEWNSWVAQGRYRDGVRIGFVLLAQHCVNHLVRFGPNGFNQGWGGKRGMLGARWEEYLSRRRPNTIFIQRDFRNASFGKEYLLYLDPPYSGTELKIYGQRWTEKDDEDLVMLIRQHTAEGGTWVLSSPLRVNGEPGKLAVLLESLGADVREVSKTYKSSVGKHARKDHVEGVLSNVGGRFIW